MAATPRLDTEAVRRRLGDLGGTIGQREAAQRSALGGAREVAGRLHAVVAEGIAAFHDAASQAGAPHLEIEQSPVRLDDKHARAVQFDLRRGLHLAIVTVKSRGDVTLVGPFRAGKPQGPCQSFPFAAGELQTGLLEFLEGFLEEAATP